MADIPPLLTASPLMTKAAPLRAGETVVIAAEIQSAPERFAEVTRPLQINGIVLSVQEGGRFIFHTASGDLALKALAPEAGRQLHEMLSPFMLNQRPLNLVIQPGSPPLQAMLNLPAQAAGSLQTQPFAAAKPLTAQPSSVFAPGTVISAVILPEEVASAFRPHPGEAIYNQKGLAGATVAADKTAEGAAEAAAKEISRGGFLTSTQKLDNLARFLKTDAGPAMGQKSHDTTMETARLAYRPAATSPAVVAAKPGTQVSFRLEEIIPADAKSSPLPRENQLLATVIGKGTNGQALLSAGTMTLFLRQTVDVSEGHRLLLTLLPQKPEPDLSLPPQTGFGLPALQRLMSALAQIEPALAQQVMQRQMPQMNELLPSTLLLLFNAIQQGGVHGWLGETAVERLKKAGKIGLVAGLAEEMRQASGIAQDPVAGQWRSWPIPVYDESGFFMLRLYVRRERDRKQEGSAYPVSPQTRFLINLNLSRLGNMQIDGLSQKKRLDLIVRSERQLPFDMPGELRAHYLKNLAALGLDGSISFQTGRSQWIEIRKAGESMGMIT